MFLFNSGCSQLKNESVVGENLLWHHAEKRRYLLRHCVGAEVCIAAAPHLHQHLVAGVICSQCNRLVQKFIVACWLLWHCGYWKFEAAKSVLTRPTVLYSSLISLPSVLWRCWLGSRKGIRPVKNWVVGCWRGYLSGARCRLAYGPADATATHCLLLQ